MQVMRRVLLATSHNQWLHQRAPRYRFVQKAVARFMPGEKLEDALEAARALKEKGITTILTQLGEDLGDLKEADAVAQHYLGVLDRVREQALDAQISVKPTQLGLDINPQRCLEHVRHLAEAAGQRQNFVWIDMEGSAFTQATLDLYRQVRTEYPNTGVALQAYLRRTEKDIRELLPVGPIIRLVKGAYNEPPEVAYPRKKDVDENFFQLGRQLLGPEVRQTGTRVAFATHDLKLIQRLGKAAEEVGLKKKEVEFKLLYGIQRGEQVRLAQAGYQVRVLISYGTQWFPWFMRRLAERPANLGFVMRNLFAG